MTSVLKQKLENFLSSNFPQLSQPDQVKIVDYVSGMEDDLEKTISNKKDRFYTKVKQYKGFNPGRFPSGLYLQFFNYWSETSKNGKQIRYDDEKFFDIGKRMATFQKRCDPLELSKMWEEDKKKDVQTQLL